MKPYGTKKVLNWEWFTDYSSKALRIAKKLNRSFKRSVRQAAKREIAKYN